MAACGIIAILFCEVQEAAVFEVFTSKEMKKTLKISATPQSLWLLAAVIGFIILVILTGPLWRSLLVAALVAYLLDPLVGRAESRLKLRRSLATAVIFLVLLLLLVGIIFALSTLVVNQAPEWSEELRQAWAEMSVWLQRPFTIPILNFTIQPQVVLDYVERATNNAFSSLPAAGGGWLGGLADNLIWSAVILVSLYYFMRDGHKIVPGLILLLPGAYQKDAQTLATELDNIWRIFLRVQLIIFAVLAVLLIASTSLILWLFRQGWLPLSPIGLIILLIVVYAAIQQVDNLWLRPQYMGEALQLHPGVVVVSLLAAFAFTGFLGALLVVPVLASLKFIFQYFHRATSPPQTEPENHQAEQIVEAHET
ncbi:MAG: hypothetical protein CL608_10870 [Anaerolineaceae bacterium]|nr:hypothetical protein [Anaerolineaceae bacterium]